MACGSARAGTTPITTALERSGVLGWLSSEFFNPYWEQGPCNRGSYCFWREYLDYALRKGTTTNGVFGWKQHGEYLQYLLARLRLIDPSFVGLDDLALLQNSFPGLDPSTSFIYIWRRDILAQAVSRLIAETSGTWTSVSPTIREPEFIKDLAKNNYWQVINEHAAWQNWFRLYGVRPICLNYEEVMADPGSEFSRVFEHVGIVCPAAAVLRPTCRRQRTSLNSGWIKYLHKILEDEVFAFGFPQELEPPFV
jgi:LPS sulfotransferase NodH